MQNQIFILISILGLVCRSFGQTACMTDAECSALNAQVPGDKTNRPGSYLCISGQCTFQVKAGSQCYRASDCAAYGYYQNQLSLNPTNPSLFPPNVNPQVFMDSLCGPQHCTMYTCNTATLYMNATNPPPLPGATTNTYCCGGIPLDYACQIYAYELDPCDNGGVCQTNPDTNSLQCFAINYRSQIWIGVIIAIICAVITNLGLNMQKYALRKRLEKQEREAELDLLEKRLELTAEELVQIKDKPNAWNTFSRNFKSKFGTLFRRSSQVPLSARPSQVSLESSVKLEDSSSESVEEAIPRKSTSNPVIMDRRRLADDKYEFKIVTEEEPESSQSMTRVRISIDDRQPEPVEPPRKSAVFAEPEPIVVDASKEAKKLTASLDIKTLVKSPIWVLGFFIFVGANLGNFVSLKYAPQSIIAPLGAVALVANVILAPLMNKEKWSWMDVVGIVMIVGGCVMVVVFGGSQEADYPLCVLLALFRQPATIAFLAVVCSLIVLIYCFIKIVEKNLEGNVKEPIPTPIRMDEIQNIEFMSNSEDAKGVKVTSNGAEAYVWMYDEKQVTPSPPPEVELGWWDKTLHWFSKTFEPLTSWWSNIHIIPRFKNPIPMNSKIVRYVLPFTYASIGGLIGTCTVLFAKSTVNLLSLSFSGFNQFNNITAWAITIFTIWSAFAQTYFVNLGLQRYDALLQIPIYFTVWTTADVIGGATFWGEFSQMTPMRIGLFCIGLFVIFAGVAVLAKRLSRIQVEEANLEAKRRGTS